MGKSTLINTLFNTPLYPPNEPLPPSAEHPKTVAIESIGAGKIPFAMKTQFLRLLKDIEESGVRLHLTVVDTPGFGDFVNNDERYGLSSLKFPFSLFLKILAGGLLWRISSRALTRIWNKRTA